MSKINKKIISIFLAFTIIFVGFNMIGTTSYAATVKLNKTNIVLLKGKTCQLKLYNTSRKVTWSSSNRSVATVSKSGKVTAKNKGKATITAKAGSKKYTCKVIVGTKQHSRDYVKRYVDKTLGYPFNVCVQGKSYDKKYRGETCYLVSYDWKTGTGFVRHTDVYIGSISLQTYAQLRTW